MKIYHQIKFSMFTMFYCFIKFVCFKSEFPLFIFVLAHFQKLLSRSIHFKKRTFFPSVFLFFFAVSYMRAQSPSQGYSTSVILTFICRLWFYCVKSKIVRTITILASGKSHDMSFLLILCFAFSVSIDSSHYGSGGNMYN